MGKKRKTDSPVGGCTSGVKCLAPTLDINASGHHCVGCNGHIHAICGEEDGGDVTCFLCLEEVEDKSDSVESIQIHQPTPVTPTTALEINTYEYNVRVGDRMLVLNAGGTANLLWQFFEKPVKGFEGKLECRLCGNKSKFNSKSTTTLSAHVSKCHKSVMTALQSKRSGNDTADFQENAKITKFFDVAGKKAPASVVNELLLDWILADDQAFIVRFCM